MKDVYYRSTLKSGAGIIGSFRYKDVFQIQPSAKSSSIQDGNFIDLEFNDKYRLNEGVEEKKNYFGQGYGHLDFLKELIALIQICTNHPCELYMEQNSIRPSPQELISGFTEHPNTPFPLTIRKSGVRILNRMNSCQDFIELQTQTEIFLDNYFNLDAKTRKRFNVSLFLLQNMRKIILVSVSMGIVGLISAIENITDFEKKKRKEKIAKCPSCLQPKYNITSQFKDFMHNHSEKKFVINNNIKEYYHTEMEYKEKESDELISSFYKRRSKITHAGDLLEMDRTLSTYSASEMRLFNEIETSVRIALFSYLLDFKNK
ncbi:hypothetical protein [Enterobacter hormaechei]|uniref:hypothetical protein n=1 Tax=Enterobacter hormaechei TaxID=158836 RepID=UPI0018887F0E|nr:hypothetical protein [Enterobacter hormaechei]MBF1961992.1 hypothetical protein [Enterobacter hormaechei]MBF1979484.1 hypothetical protein [Enterobacter hormaechei]